MTQIRSENQHQFLVRCKESYDLIQGFLNDSLPWGPVPQRRSGYKFDASVREATKEKIVVSMEKLGQAIDGHGLEELAISYNGGKDCLVMLILLLAVIHKKFCSSNIDNSSLPYNFKLDSIYINSEDQFPQLTDFIAESTNYYHLNSIMIKCSLKKGFEHYLKQINTNIRAIIVGIRYSDPYGSELKYEQTTDHNWPDFLRIHPILHWTYVEIWDFLVGTNLDYCEMYDLGYTSLGGISNTVPNPYLKVEGKEEYLPAYMLTERADERERLGRTKK